MITMTPRLIERLYPYITAFLLGAVYWKFVAAFPDKTDILSSSISLGAILTGFLATAKSILVSLDTPAIQRLKSTRFYSLMVDYLREAIAIALLYCVVSLVGYFLSDQVREWHKWYGTLWTFLGTATLLTFYRVTRNILHLMKV